MTFQFNMFYWILYKFQALRFRNCCICCEREKGKRRCASTRCAWIEKSKGRGDAKGLHHIFEEAGFEWREPGCSMCLGMNPDQVPEGEHCASTSNRNFEGRQGKGARTHLVSPAMAAAAALYGHFVDIRKESYDGAISYS